jgi:hypothetical protein
MGQAASKARSQVSKAVGDRAKQMMEKEVGKQASTSPIDKTSNNAVSTAANPGNFFRGEIEDPRDQIQQTYLEQQHKRTKDQGPQDLSPELLKFISDVGPAKKEIDQEFTSPNVMKDAEELSKMKKAQSRDRKRQRQTMPLMTGDDNFTTVRNTNFSHGKEEEKKDFGTSNLQFYSLLTRKEAGDNIDELVESFWKATTSEDDGWTEEEKELCKHLLKSSIESIELPVFLKDSDANFIGTYKNKVPGPEVKGIQAVPETKIKLVLKDVAEEQVKLNQTLRANLERSKNRKRTGKPQTS